MRRHRVLFSIREMMATVALISAPLAACAAPASWFTGLAMLLLGMAIPPAFWIGWRFGTGYARAFCVGAFSPAMVVSVAVTWRFTQYMDGGDLMNYRYLSENLAATLRI